MVLVDAIARRLPGALAEGSGELESFSAELGGGLEYPHYTRPAEFRGWRGARRPALRRPRADRALAEGARAVRNPVDRLTDGLPHGWRVTIDWLVTIVGAIVIVLAIKQWVVNPYRIPSSSMEPTLHCARPGPGCEARFSDRVLACRFCYHFWTPKRGDIIVFKTPPLAGAALRRGRHVRQAPDRPPRRDVCEERTATSASTASGSNEPYIQADAAATHARTRRARSCRATTSSWATTAA